MIGGNAQVLVARVSCVDSKWIHPRNRGDNAALISLHNDRFLWADDGDTVGFVRIASGVTGRMVDLLYVPRSCAGRVLVADNLRFLRYLCPVSGKTVQQEIQRLAARSSYSGVRAGGVALGVVAGLLTDRVIDGVFEVIRNATSSGYYDVETGNLYFDAPITRGDLAVTTAGELLRLGFPVEPLHAGR